MSIVLMSQVLIFALFRFISSQQEHPELNKDVIGVTNLLKSKIEEYSQTLHVTSASQSDRISAYFSETAKMIHAQIWLKNEKNIVIASSENEDFSFFPEEKTMNHENSIYHTGRPPNIFVKTNVHLSDNSNAFLYMILDRPRNRPDDAGFFIGLGLITLFIAVILFPLSRKITIPLKKLTASAHAISEGNFDLKIKNTSHDEIGELARTFNAMSEKLLQMIRGTKELTANISHQIRSPLTRISVAAEMMHDHLRASDIENSKRFLDSIQRETATIDVLTGKIIDLIRAETAHIQSDYMPIDMNAAIDTALHNYNDMMLSRNLTYTLHLTQKDNIVAGIQPDIEHMLDILFDNAVRYSPDGSDITVELHNKSSEIHCIVRNKISRQLDADDLIEIFSPFSRKASSRIPGYGLGLAIAKRIAENHKGKMHAENHDHIFSIHVMFPQKKFA
jgi:signal transduction histidine kinase